MSRGPTRSERLHGDAVLDGGPPPFERVHAWVRRIPAGRVMSYGQISVLMESRLSPAAVGWALHSCPEGVPWHRVVNASGGLSTERLPNIPPGLQRAMLEAEGVEFRANGTLDLDDYRWIPPEDAR